MKLCCTSKIVDFLAFFQKVLASQAIISKKSFIFFLSQRKKELSGEIRLRDKRTLTTLTTLTIFDYF